MCMCSLQCKLFQNEVATKNIKKQCDKEGKHHISKGSSEKIARIAVVCLMSAVCYNEAVLLFCWSGGSTKRQAWVCLTLC